MGQTSLLHKPLHYLNNKKKLFAFIKLKNQCIFDRFITIFVFFNSATKDIRKKKKRKNTPIG